MFNSTKKVVGCQDSYAMLMVSTSLCCFVVKYGIFILVFFLSACTGSKSLQSDPTLLAAKKITYQKKSQLLRSLKQWGLTGAIAIKSGDEGWQARIIWDEFPDHYAGRIYAYLTSEYLVIKGDQQGVSLSDNHGQIYRGRSLADLIQKQVAWTIPMDHLRYWLKGLAIPNQPYEAEYDADSNFKTLKQSGWHLLYKNYYFISGYYLPKYIILYQNDLRIKLVIAKWTF